MGMRLVDRPRFKPHHCAAIPFLGQTAENTRWVDTGVEMAGFDNHVFLSSVAVAEAGKLLGFPSPADHAKLAAELATALTELQASLDRQAELERYAAAVEEIRSGA